eukprot:3263155-Amphidinium_carterae.1
MHVIAYVSTVTIATSKPTAKSLRHSESPPAHFGIYVSAVWVGLSFHDVQTNHNSNLKPYPNTKYSFR